MKAMNVGLLGIGTVGGGTYTVLKRNAEEITRRAGRPIEITVVADRNLELARKVTGGTCRLTDDAFSVVADPEVDVSSKRNAMTPGVDYAAYPKSRTFVGGINITF